MSNDKTFPNMTSGKIQSLKFAFSLLILFAALAGAVWIVVSPEQQVSAKVVTQESKPQSKAKKAIPKSTLTLARIFRRSIGSSEFSMPIEEEIRAFEKLLKDSIGESFANEQTVLKWKRLGWVVHVFEDKQLVIIEEHQSRRSGRGLYAIRTSVVDPIVVQAPHRFFDTDTGVIAKQLFERQQIQAAAWNTVHRKHFDIAHQSRSFFNAFTKVMTEKYPDIVNIQVHGFDATKRQGFHPEAASTLAIISNATRSPNRMTKNFARELKTLFGKDRVWLYPTETHELGATTNEQASVMRAQGSQKFIHVEMSKTLRDQLLKSPGKQSRLYEAFRTTLKSGCLGGIGN